MDILTIIVAALLVFLAFKFVAGVIKFVLVAAILIVAIALVTGGMPL